MNAEVKVHHVRGWHAWRARCTEHGWLDPAFSEPEAQDHAEAHAYANAGCVVVSRYPR